VKPKVLTLALLFVSSVGVTAPNESFKKARTMMMEVYFDHQETIYCGAQFDSKKAITLPDGYASTKYIKRSTIVEAEHVVAAKDFGESFIEWSEGSSVCIDYKGEEYSGRRCANKANREYRLMQADLYNLYPAIGSVNALRSNYHFTLLPGEESDFGSCQMKIANRKAEPPIAARGRIARTYLYMEQTYDRYTMSKDQRKLMLAWNKMHPISEWECKRASRIEAIQGNNNLLLSECDKL